MLSTILQICSSEISDDAAKALAEDAVSISAFLKVLVVGEGTFPPVGAHMESVSKPWLEERESSRSKLFQREKSLRDLYQKMHLSCDVETMFAEALRLDNALGLVARFTDLVVVGPDIIDDLTTLKAVLDAALFHANVPVLLVPAGASLRPITRAVIAWSKEPETAAAIRASIPLLRLAGDVVIVTVDPSDDLETQISGAIEYISKCGIGPVTVERISSDGRTVVDALESYLRDVGGELLVMGAYSKPRMVERIFGGVTDSILLHPIRAVLASR